jgi:hypothetical protein
MRKVIPFHPKNIGKAFQTMMDFIGKHHVLEIVVIGETHTFPGKTDRLVLKAPKRPKIRRGKLRGMTFVRRARRR